MNVPGVAHDAAAQIASRGTPLSAAHDVVTLLVEWHLTPDGGGAATGPIGVLDGVDDPVGQPLFGQSTTPVRAPRDTQTIALTAEYWQ